jgi:murein DD-endopeptidase MepM/ murein hydrolase activator NlpD
VQSYVDHDLSKASRDYQCGSRTYDGHNGTDIRLLDLGLQRRGVEVLAAATGHVVGARDGMTDISVRTIGKAAIAGKECGNGVVLEHDDGWQTQYCHMAKGSVRVKTGDRVAEGQPIGLVGLSGDTEFPHLHFTVRLAGAIIDPFAFGPALDSCNSGGRSLWASALHARLDYRAREILNYGFSGQPPTMELIESGDIKDHPPNRQSGALAAYVRVIGLQKGDEQMLTISGPDASLFSEHASPALESNKAQYFISSGRNRKTSAWPQGNYAATYRVTRNGAELLRKTFDIKVD